MDKVEVDPGQPQVSANYGFACGAQETRVMTPRSRLRKEIEKIGYSAIIDDYVFSDVFASSPVNRKVPVAAFTHTPPSYRNAAFAVLHAETGPPEDTVSGYRALGAPVMFVIKGDDVTVWQVRPETGPVHLGSANQDQLSELFYENSEAWAPQSIQHPNLLISSVLSTN